MNYKQTIVVIHVQEHDLQIPADFIGNALKFS